MPSIYCPKCGDVETMDDWYKYCEYCGTKLQKLNVSTLEEYGKYTKEGEERYKNLELLMYPEKLDREAIQHRLDIIGGRIPNTLPDPNAEFRPKKSWFDKFLDWFPEDPKHEAKMTTVVKCPYCGSTDTKKIGVGGRAVSTATLGLASGKIGKQWHCKKCGSDF